MNRSLLTPRWILTTLLVIAAVGVMARLGFWQLERLEERRVFNERVQAQIDAPPLDLNQYLPIEQIYDMEYREAVVQGEYDPQNEIVLRNEVYQNRPAYRLITPLRIHGSAQVVLVDRGIIPMEDGEPEQRQKYAQAGTVTVHGILRRGHVPRYFGAPDPTLAPDQQRLDAWNAFNIERIQAQSPYPLLPVYLQSEPDPIREGPPYASLDQPEITDGSHLGYAFQWFAFAAILGLGYPFFVRKQLADKV
jgi:surfeit locus 1 family protein